MKQVCVWDSPPPFRDSMMIPFVFYFLCKQTNKGSARQKWQAGLNASDSVQNVRKSQMQPMPLFRNTHICKSVLRVHFFITAISLSKFKCIAIAFVQNVRKSYVQPMLLFRNTVLRVHFFITAISLSKDLRLTYVVVTSQQLLLEIRTQHLATQVIHCWEYAFIAVISVSKDHLRRKLLLSKNWPMRSCDVSIVEIQAWYKTQHCPKHASWN